MSDESRPDPEGQVLSIAFPPTSSAEDLYFRSPVGLESSLSMPHVEPNWKDDSVFQASDSLTRPSQLRTSDEL